MSRAHPLVPLALLLGLTVSVFFIESRAVLLVLLCGLLALHWREGAGRFTGIVLALSAASLPWMLILFWWAGYEQTGSWSAGFPWAIANLLLLLLRLLLLLMANLYVIRTVSFRRLATALRTLGLPEPAVLFVSTVVRFLPICGEEARRILEVQRCREFNPRRLFYDPRAMLPIFVPLFIAQMKRAHDLALSLEIRHVRWEATARAKGEPLAKRDLLVVTVGLLLMILLARYC